MADRFQGAIDQVRDELFLDRADGRYLDVIGENFGVFRPRAGVDDDTWRQVLRLVLMSPKTTAERLVALLDALLGDLVRIDYVGDAVTAPPDLRVEVLLDPNAPPASPQPPAFAVRLTGQGLPADAPAAPGPGSVTIPATGVQVGTPGSPAPVPVPGPEIVVARALGGATTAQLAFAPVVAGSVELWVNPQTPAAPDPVRLDRAHFDVDAGGLITFDVLPAPLTFFAVDPSTGTPIPRPGLPLGAEVLATYRIDTRTFAGLGAALRLKLPPVYRMTLSEVSSAHAWADLEAADQSMEAVLLPGPPATEDPNPRFLTLVTRIDLRSWALYDVGRAQGPPDAQPTTPFLDQQTVGPRVFVDLRRRDDVTHVRADLRQASYLHDDLDHPAPVAVPDHTLLEPAGEPWQLPPVPAIEPAPQLWAVHPWNRSGDPNRLATDPGFPGPYVYTFDVRLAPCGRERVPGDPTTWEPFAEEFANVLAHDPRSGRDLPVVVRQEPGALNPFTGSPLETAPGSGVLYRDLAVPRPYVPHPDRSDHPLVLFADNFWVDRLKSLVDLVRAAGVFVTFERGPDPTPDSAPPWFCEPCYVLRFYAEAP